MTWAIIDTATKSPYIYRTWERQSEAEYERACLLKGYPVTSEWHSRLQVVPWDRPSYVRMRRPGLRPSEERQADRSLLKQIEADMAADLKLLQRETKKGTSDD